MSVVLSLLRDSLTNLCNPNLYRLQTIRRRLSVLNGYIGCTEEDCKNLEQSLSTTEHISFKESEHEQAETR